MAKGRIAGITIEIGADTSKVTKAFNDVNKSLRNTGNSLKDVDKLLKLKPGNVELLTQKQEYLTKAIDDTKKKLEVEEEALKKLKEKGVNTAVDTCGYVAKEILEKVKNNDNVFIIGGEAIYHLFLEDSLTKKILAALILQDNIGIIKYQTLIDALMKMSTYTTL